MRSTTGQRGFTLIEVMIVVAVIGILASIIMPNVRQYGIRGKMSEAILAFTNCRNMITEIYLSADSPPGADNFGCESSDQLSQYVLSVHTTVDGVIKVTLTGFNDLRIDTHDITLAPLDFRDLYPTVGLGQILKWRCGSPLDGTTVSPLYLPGSCKGV